jgi:hypothetical protein
VAPYREAFRTKLAVLLEHRLFYIPSFKIYGASAPLTAVQYAACYQSGPAFYAIACCVLRRRRRWAVRLRADWVRCEI